ncbi:transposase [Streptomyces sp. NPDC056683]|uniref:transposase n=1 Tax=Streptomyces sp. NPDC056683 TaxID=3345910 RepID=UPI0036A9C142
MVLGHPRTPPAVSSGQIRDHLSHHVRRGAPGRQRHQSATAAATAGKECRCYDPGNKVNSRKRHLVIDLCGLPLMVMVTPTDLHASVVQEVLFRLRLMHPEITSVQGDRAYAVKLVTWAKRHLNLTVNTVNRPKATGFGIPARPGALERSIAWMMNARRHDRDYERLIQHSKTLITWASITLMTRRPTRTTPLPTVACTSRADTDLRLPHRCEQLQVQEVRLMPALPDVRYRVVTAGGRRRLRLDPRPAQWLWRSASLRARGAPRNSDRPP